MNEAMKVVLETMQAGFAVCVDTSNIEVFMDEKLFQKMKEEVKDGLCFHIVYSSEDGCYTQYVATNKFVVKYHQSGGMWSYLDSETEFLNSVKESFGELID